MRSERHRMLVVGHGTASSGYGRVIYNLLNHLDCEFEVHHFAINVRAVESESVPWAQYPNSEQFDPWGAAQLPRLVRQIEPALVLFIGDRIWHAASAEGLRALREQGLKVLLYCPIEGRCVYPEALFAFTELDRLILFTTFAKSIVTEAFAQHDVFKGYPLPTIDIIPHGLDLKTFCPLNTDPNQRLAARQKLLPSRPDHHEGMWLLNANRCYPRKHLELTLEAFARFSVHKPKNVRLVMLHLDTNDEAQMTWVYQIDDPERILTKSDFQLPIDDVQLNLIYNACEIGINSSSSEGWGLVAFEHGATAAAQIVPEHTACQDLWQEVGLLIEIENCVSAPNGMYYEEVSAKSIANHMEHLYRDPQLLLAMSDAVQKYCQSPRFQWAAIAQQWVKIINQMLSD